ncbi:MAG: hypothetical protein Tsb0021_08850 [Chlamydiales bacterium]
MLNCWLLALCLMTTHPNPANHFAEFTEVFDEHAVPYTLITSESVSHSFSQNPSYILDPTQEFVAQIAELISREDLVITDISDERFVQLHQYLAKYYPSIHRAVYYDNPECYVPGGYSDLAEKMIEEIQTVLCANRLLPSIGLKGKNALPMEISNINLIGLGFYPIRQAEEIRESRAHQDQIEEIKSALFRRCDIPEAEQRIFTYIGGCNEVYFDKAFPHFLNSLTELVAREDPSLNQTIILLQQHPRAKKEGDWDALQAREFLAKHSLPAGFRFVISDLSTHDALTISDGVLYFQTSMAAQCVFGGIPSIAQIGHEVYEDTLVRSGFPTIKSATDLSHFLRGQQKMPSTNNLKSELGMDTHWRQNLLDWISTFLHDPIRPTVYALPPTRLD